MAKQNKPDSKQVIDTDYSPREGTENYYHVNLNTRIHTDSNGGDYLDNWNVRILNKKDFENFCKNGSQLRYFAELSQQEIEAGLTVFDKPENKRFIELLCTPII
jgi:hypothetical protein